MSDRSYKAAIFLKRKLGLSLPEFRAYYEDVHARLAGKYLSGATRYVRRYVEPVPNRETGQDGELDFDVITEVWFTERAPRDAMLAFGSKMALPSEILADEEKLFDRSKTRYAAVDEFDTAIGVD